MYSPTANDTITATSSNGNAGRDLSTRGRTESGAKNSPLSLKYRVRFFSAKPIREAFARMLVLQQTGADEQKVKALSEKMQAWVDVDYWRYRGGSCFNRSHGSTVERPGRASISERDRRDAEKLLLS